jgi:hypothetical protein
VIGDAGEAAVALMDALSATEEFCANLLTKKKIHEIRSA